MFGKHVQPLLPGFCTSDALVTTSQKVVTGPAPHPRCWRRRIWISAHGCRLPTAQMPSPHIEFAKRAPCGQILVRQIFTMPGLPSGMHVDVMCNVPTQTISCAGLCLDCDVIRVRTDKTNPAVMQCAKRRACLSTCYIPGGLQLPSLLCRRKNAGMCSARMHKHRFSFAGNTCGMSSQLSTQSRGARQESSLMGPSTAVVGRVRPGGKVSN